MLHRKMWEWLFIAQPWPRRDMLRPGRVGLGFGVGREPLVALFASMSCDVVATDQPERGRCRRAGPTRRSSGPAASPGSTRTACARTTCSRPHVRYREVDMNALPRNLRNFDFTWSSCALEHLGSLQAGADFVLAQMRC